MSTTSLVDFSSIQESSVMESVLPEELEFYQTYEWCLNPYLNVSEALQHLREELSKLQATSEWWQSYEIATNIFLLSCGLLNCLDEHLRGSALRIPARLRGTVAGRCSAWLFEILSSRPWLGRRMRRWRNRWLENLNDFLKDFVHERRLEPALLVRSAHKLMVLMESPMPPDLGGMRVSTPTAFSRLDLTHEDFLALSRTFVDRFPERTQSLLIVGLRTSGSYVAPLLRAFLEVEGYENVSLVTIEPNKGAGRSELKALKRFAERGYLALIVDDPPYTNRTLFAALDVVHRAGFAPNKFQFVVPTHPATRNWFKTLPEHNVITLQPQQWHKRALLDPKAVEVRLTEYFSNKGFTAVSVNESRYSNEVNAHLQEVPGDQRGLRLKKVYEVDLETSRGKKETKYVLAKSVGWGWLGYHAFLIGYRLSGYVPSILGLRDGILYMEWIVQPNREASRRREKLIEASALYVAARVRSLSLEAHPTEGRDVKRYSSGNQVLEKVLSRAYGSIFVDILMQSRIGVQIKKQPSPFHTLIDGRMHPDEWIMGSKGLLKTDFEHHGKGKSSLNVTDPAYDLAETILNLGLSSEEADSLVRRYAAESGDVTVHKRLFIQKLLAGISAMQVAQELFFAVPQSRNAQLEFHQRFMNAWNFLTVESARHCGSFSSRSVKLRWDTPLIALDIDGVLDRRIFGFPCTTGAGIEALSLLNTHGYTVALNTARSVAEVSEYCSAYSLAGGVAEHGSVLWDAVHQRERILIDAETELQLETLRRRLRHIPGVFLDERHRYSIRAFTYREKPLGLIQSLLRSARASAVGDGGLAPISTHILNQLFVEMGLDRLSYHHTMIDTTVVAKEADKGTGLIALRDWVLTAEAETIAIGDTEHDLAMFRAATRSFAPANIGCRRQARLFGCRIARQPNQRGLLEIVSQIVRQGMERCEKCAAADVPIHPAEDLFISVLRDADRSLLKNLFRAVFDVAVLKTFIR